MEILDVVNFMCENNISTMPSFKFVSSVLNDAVCGSLVNRDMSWIRLGISSFILWFICYSCNLIFVRASRLLVRNEPRHIKT